MKVDAVRAKALVSQLQDVQLRIANVAKGRNVSFLFFVLCVQHAHFHCNPEPPSSRLTLCVVPLPRRLRGLRCRTGEGPGVGPI